MENAKHFEFPLKLFRKILLGSSERVCQSYKERNRNLESCESCESMLKNRKESTKKGKRKEVSIVNRSRQLVVEFTYPKVTLINF